MKSLGGSHRKYVKNEESIVSTTMFSYDRDTIRIIWVPFSFLLTGRIAHAVRGLKSVTGKLKVSAVESHRSRGAWIEIAWR